MNILTNFETKEREHPYIRGAYTLLLVRMGANLLRDANETGVEKKSKIFKSVPLGKG